MTASEEQKGDPEDSKLKVFNLSDFEIATMDLYPTLDKDDTLNKHRELDVISQLNPLFLKNEAHLTAEESKVSEAFKRRMERRVESIKARCDFNEIQKYKNLFDKKTYNQLLSQSLSKTDET